MGGSIGRMCGFWLIELDKREGKVRLGRLMDMAGHGALGGVFARADLYYLGWAKGKAGISALLQIFDGHGEGFVVPGKMAGRG